MRGPTPAHVRLRVRDAEAARVFWEGVLGLSVESGQRGLRVAPPGGGAPFLYLDVDPGAEPPDPRAAGLFHVALRVPGREHLARVHRRLRTLGKPLQGAADHEVSEALYLGDAEGNGVEIYADRPAEGWVWTDGGVRMATEPLGVRGLLESTAGEAGLPGGTTLGHVHLRTTDLAAAEGFWTTEVGLQVTTRAWPGALFLASGGYHHHLGINTWGGPLRRAGRGAAGLVETAWRVPDRSDRAVLEDPDGHGVVLLPAGAPGAG